MPKTFSLKWVKQTTLDDNVEWSEYGVCGDIIFELYKDKIKNIIVFNDLKRGVKYNIRDKSIGYIIAFKILKKY